MISAEFSLEELEESYVKTNKREFYERTQSSFCARRVYFSARVALVVAHSHLLPVLSRIIYQATSDRNYYKNGARGVYSHPSGYSTPLGRRYGRIQEDFET